MPASSDLLRKMWAWLKRSTEKVTGSIELLVLPYFVCLSPFKIPCKLAYL